jgi:hypothetical protein
VRKNNVGAGWGRVVDVVGVRVVVYGSLVEEVLGLDGGMVGVIVGAALVGVPELATDTVPVLEEVLP